MRFIIKAILICSVACLGWAYPLNITLFAQQSDEFQSNIIGYWRMSDLSGDALQAIIPDFQVNENAGGSSKSSPVMSVDGNGNIVAAWSDSRDGYARIYAQRFNRSGMPVGVNFQVDDDAANLEQGSCDIAVKENGDFVIVWLETNSLSTSERENDIVAMMFDGSGAALGKTFKVTEESGLPINSPYIAMGTSGEFMIVWQDERLGNWDIFAQRCNRTGSLVGANFKVNDESSGTKQNPQIAAMGAGEFMVVWEDGRLGGNACIFAQRFDSLGTALGPNFLLIESGGDITELTLAANPNGNAVIVWDEWQDADRDLYAQHFSRSDTVVAKGFKVNELTMRRGFFNAEVAITPRGDFCVTWHGDEEDQDVIFAKWYDRIGIVRGAQKRINEKYSLAYHSFPSLCADNDGNYTLAWVDLRNGQPDIYAQRFDSSGNALEANFKMNDDVGSADQKLSDISANANGDFVVAWADYRESSPPWFVYHSNIYAKRFNPAGIALDKDFKVNDDPTTNYIWSPKVAIAPSGQSMVVWYENRKGISNIDSWDVYAQFYSATGAPIGTNILVSADTGKVDNREPNIAVDANGNFVIVWSGSSPFVTSNFFCGIFFRKYDSSGIPIGSGKVAENGSYPNVAIAPNGDFMVVWKATDIYAQVYNGEGIRQGTAIKVNPSGREPAVTVAGDGNYFVIWSERINSSWEIYARRYDRYGIALGEKFKVNDQRRGNWQTNLSVSSDQDGNVLVVWNDNRQDYWDIMAQRYNALGQPMGGNFCPTKNTELDQEWPSTQVVNGKIYLAWQTNHVGGTGYDIWANVLDWHSPVVKIENMNPVEPSISFSLSQNYPNPANPCTKIKYALPEREWVTIKIFDLSGREVRVLVHEIQSQGWHEIAWDGKDAHGQVVASGIYFYQFKSGQHSAVKRMVLLR